MFPAYASCYLFFATQILSVAPITSVLKRTTSPLSILKPRTWYDSHLDPYSESIYDLPDFGESTTGTPVSTESHPYFEDGPVPIEMTVQLGSTIYLQCKVNELKEKTISWVRKRGDELHLLSFGRHTYSADSRYSLAYEQPNNWRLYIQFVGERDEGYYECQVSSHPPIIKKIHLRVIVPKMEIVDERGLSITGKFYKEGSIIELRCVVSRVPDPTKLIIWEHAGRMLNFDSLRGGISVKSEVTVGGALSRLYIANANIKDSGNYTCALPDISAITVSIHVLKGENPSAMQRGTASYKSHSFLCIAISILLAIS